METVGRPSLVNKVRDNLIDHHHHHHHQTLNTLMSVSFMRVSSYLEKLRHTIVKVVPDPRAKR